MIRVLSKIPRELGPPNSEIDPIGYFLERLQTNLLWIDEHRSSYQSYRNDDHEAAEVELDYLKNVTDQSIIYLQQLTELLLSKSTIDSNKVLPKGLCQEAWRRTVTQISEQAKSQVASCNSDQNDRPEHGATKL
jgi:hypothetical protein